LHILCEGEKTEPNYLSSYIEAYCQANRRLQVIKIEKTKANTPVTLVNAAIKEKGKVPDGDVFWVVYDRESQQKHSDKLHADAYEKAQQKDIKLAISNVCFELWLLLHFQDSAAPYSSYDDLIKNSPLRAECKKRDLADYAKGNKQLFSELSQAEIAQARRRAEKINQASQAAATSPQRPYQLNPYTDVHKLLAAIDDFIKTTAAG
jgi:hypothetical protein